MAAGGSFDVPRGFNNDSFPMMVQSGERVTVETPLQQRQAVSGNNSSPLLESINRSLISIKNKQDNIRSESSVTGNQITTVVEKSQDRRSRYS